MGREAGGLRVETGLPGLTDPGTTMSQHCFTTQLDGQPVEIIMGWDRPMQGFFMTIERVHAPRGTHDDAPVYCSLRDPDLAGTRGITLSLTHFERKLAALGLQVPPQMLQEICEDGGANAGNRYVCYDLAGVSSEAIC